MQPLAGTGAAGLTPFVKKMKIFFLIPIPVYALKFLLNLVYLLNEGRYFSPFFLNSFFLNALSFFLIVLPLLASLGTILYAKTRSHIAIASGTFVALYVLSLVARLFMFGYIYDGALSGILEFFSLLTALGALALMIISLVYTGSGRERVWNAALAWNQKTAASSSSPTSPIMTQSSPVSDLDWQMKQLERLAALHNSGALTKAEFTKKKKEILGKDAD